MHERKKEMLDFMNNFDEMPDRLLKYNEILLKGEDATSYCYQDTMSYRRLAIKLTNFCNLECKWCYRQDSHYKPLLNKEMPFSKLKSIVNNIEEKFRLVHLSGLGEPLLYPHLIEAIALVKKLSEKVKVTTNGTLLSKERICKMVEAGLTHIEVSIDAFSDEKNKEFRGSDLSDLVENVIYISNNTDLFLQINSVVCSLNYDSLDNMAKVLKEAKNIDIIHTIPIFTTEQIREAGVTKVSDKAYKALLERWEADIKKDGLAWKLFPSLHGVSLDPIIEMKRKRNICFTCFEDPTIGTHGFFGACGRRLFEPLSDATNGFEAGWNHPKMLEFREKMLKGNYPDFCGKLCYLKEK